MDKGKTEKHRKWEDDIKLGEAKMCEDSEGQNKMEDTRIPTNYKQTFSKQYSSLILTK